MEQLEAMLQNQVEDEFRGVLKYDEIIEEFVRHKDKINDADKYITTLRGIQKQQATHCLELVNMVMDLGFKEPTVVQKLEDYYKIEGYSDCVKSKIRGMIFTSDEQREYAIEQAKKECGEI